ncbi:MAG: endonuclease NucS [Chloroflexi bacterium]|nr:endonuclease NucS [Chloroflexota bacterium]
MTSIYDRPARELIQTALADMPDPFTSQDMVQWFGEHYDRVNPSTVRAHLRRASVNIPPDVSGKYWSETDRTVYRLSPGQFTRYRPDVHGVFEDGIPSGLAEETDDDATGGDQVDEADASFALELHLEEFMEANWASIEFGRPLQVWTDDDGEWGRQYRTEVGTIDFLCEDEATHEMVVVELKRGKSSDQVVGQVLRYMGWVREHLSNGRGVSGIIITHDYDQRVRYAVAELPSVEAWTYQVSFSLNTKAYAS